MIVLAHGGDDLEAFPFDSTLGWVEAAGVFFQVASALASAEDWTEFEVRIEITSRALLSTGSPPSIFVLGEQSADRCSIATSTKDKCSSPRTPSWAPAPARPTP